MPRVSDFDKIVQKGKRTPLRMKAGLSIHSLAQLEVSRPIVKRVQPIANSVEIFQQNV